MTHKPYHPQLKKMFASTAIICTALVLVGCGSSSSKSSMTVTSRGTPPATLPSPAFTHDRVFLNFTHMDATAPKLASGEANGDHARLSLPVQFATANTVQDTPNHGVIHQASNILNAGGDTPRNTIDNLIVAITNPTGDATNPLYSLNFVSHSQATGTDVRAAKTLDIMSTDLNDREHTTLTTRYGSNLKLSSISGELTDSGDNFYVDIYTNHGESHNEETFGNTNYLAMGSWVRVDTTTAETDIGTFVHGIDELSTSDAAKLVNGSATYEGTAVGLIAVYPTSDDANYVVPILADVNLVANFGDGEASGTIGNFIVRGSGFSGITTPIDGRINLGAGNPNTSTVGAFFRGAIASGSALTFNGRSQEYSGNWGAQFYGDLDNNDHPARAAGTLAAGSSNHAAQNTNLYLSFGVYREAN